MAKKTTAKSKKSTPTKTVKSRPSKKAASKKSKPAKKKSTKKTTSIKKKLKKAIRKKAKQARKKVKKLTEKWDIGVAKYLTKTWHFNEGDTVVVKHDNDPKYQTYAGRVTSVKEDSIDVKLVYRGRLKDRNYHPTQLVKIEY